MILYATYKNTNKICLFPYSLTYFQLYLLCNPLPFILSPLSISLQSWGGTALAAASENGHAEAIKILLTVPDVDVNHTDVSPYLLTLLYLLVGGGCKGDHPPTFPYVSSSLFLCLTYFQMYM